LFFRYLLRSGNPEHPGDKFFNTSVQVLSTTYAGKADGNLGSNNSTDNYRITHDGFHVINQFDDDSGLAEGTVPTWLGPIDVLRLYVETTGASWVILSEVSLSTFSAVSRFFLYHDQQLTTNEMKRSTIPFASRQKYSR
jgi:alpha-1,3-mannosylglycoprotein beta-1,4-N-acetylglucosaminyltransferase A/B